VQNSRRLALYHFWVAFGLFLPAVVLGTWQMLMRSPLPAPLDDPDAYYASVTLHGTVMAYVLTTFFAMGFGFAIAATSLGRPIRGLAAAWAGFVICLVGTLMAAATVIADRATVLYTFYPPLLASPWYYLGAFLLIGGSMIWVGRCRLRCSRSPLPRCCGRGRRPAPSSSSSAYCCRGRSAGAI
jgi:cytochrome c oxidase subunit I